MIGDTTRTVRSKVQDDIGPTARDEFQKQAEVARGEVEKQADEKREELGYRVFDLAEAYFPEAATDRRRRYLATGAAIGVGAGFVLRHVLDR